MLARLRNAGRSAVRLERGPKAPPLDAAFRGAAFPAVQRITASVADEPALVAEGRARRSDARVARATLARNRPTAAGLGRLARPAHEETAAAVPRESAEDVLVIARSWSARSHAAVQRPGMAAQAEPAASAEIGRLA
jgi:hypothetical protein